MPLPIRALWQGASEEQRAVAHRTATAILRTWLGKARREEAARELGLSAIRLWQLSQQAVCGLVVGCLRQPRFRGRPPATLPGLGPQESVGALKRRIAVLERELSGSQRLLEVLRELPGNREGGRATGAEAKAWHGRVEGRRSPGPGADGRATGVDRTEAGDVAR
jgi:hypothetical protein